MKSQYPYLLVSLMIFLSCKSNDSPTGNSDKETNWMSAKIDGASWVTEGNSSLGRKNVYVYYDSSLSRYVIQGTTDYLYPRIVIEITTLRVGTFQLGDIATNNAEASYLSEYFY